MSVIRPSWPSTDLWKRLATGQIADDTPCPNCECPAITHQRDANVGALFCPVANTKDDKAKLWAMVRMTDKYQNYEVPKDDGGFGWMRSKTRLPFPVQGIDAADLETFNKEVDQAKELYPDFNELRPWLIPLVSQNPDVGLLELCVIAKDRYETAKAKAATKTEQARRDLEEYNRKQDERDRERMKRELAIGDRNAQKEREARRRSAALARGRRLAGKKAEKEEAAMLFPKTVRRYGNED